MKTSFKNLWCIVSPSGEILIGSISYQKSISTAWLTNGAPMEWKEYKQNGWDCIKVNLKIDRV